MFHDYYNSAFSEEHLNLLCTIPRHLNEFQIQKSAQHQKSKEKAEKIEARRKITLIKE